MESAQTLNKNFSEAIADLMRKKQQPQNDNVPRLQNNNQDTLSRYMYPTMIILPIVIVVVLLLASKAHIAIKIIGIILLLFVIVVYHLQQNNIDILSYIQPRGNTNVSQ